MTKQGVVLDFDSHPYLESDDFPTRFDIAISEVPPISPTQNRISEADRVGHLGARFEFDARDHSFVSLFASGLFVNSDKQEDLNKLVDSHPEWSETQVTEALVSAGAKFGPGEKVKLLAGFPAQNLEQVVGKIHITSSEFTFRGNKTPPFYAVMQWTLNFQATIGGHSDEYFTLVEPFGGRVTMLGRRRLK